ncbi:MAG: cyclic nucleotide-binding domain-containing protein [Rhodothermales bacterium]|nr:cyclic nucleotide-binding domain-containing protein [Rhodothermales bacterium]
MTTLQRFTESLRRFHRRLFTRDDDERIRSRVNALRSSPVFGDMTKRHLVRVAEVMHERRFKRDEHIYYENDPGLGLYLISDGRVRLARRDEDDRDVDIAELGEGDIFGVLSVFEDLRRTESAQSRADTVLLGLFRPDLNAVLNRSPSAGAAVYKVLARHVGRRYSSLLNCVEETCGRTQTMAMLTETTITKEMA